MGLRGRPQNGYSLAIRNDLYSRLGVTTEQVASAPQITPQLRLISATLRRAGQPKVTRRIVDKGGSNGLIIAEDTHHASPYSAGTDLARSWPMYLQSSDYPESEKLLKVYRIVPKSLARLVPIEAFCLAANVSPARVLEIITAVVVRYGVQASAVIASVNQPRVVQKSVEMALTDGGIEDRTLLSKATGFLPSPRGAQTNIQVNASAAATADAKSQTVIVESPEQTIRTLSDRFNELRKLPSASATPAQLSSASASTTPPLPASFDPSTQHVAEAIEYIDAGLDDDDPEEEEADDH